MVTDHFFVLQPCNRHYGNPRVENINTKSSSLIADVFRALASQQSPPLGPPRKRAKTS